MAEIPIGEVARRAGIAASAVRYYEARGLLPEAGRRGGRRVWNEAVVGRLRLVALAREAGFTLAETGQLLAGFERRRPPGERWRELAAAKLAELDRRIAEAQRMKRVLGRVTACRCPRLDDCAELLREADSAPAPGDDSAP